MSTCVYLIPLSVFSLLKVKKYGKMNLLVHQSNLKKGGNAIILDCVKNKAYK